MPWLLAAQWTCQKQKTQRDSQCLPFLGRVEQAVVFAPCGFCHRLMPSNRLWSNDLSKQQQEHQLQEGLLKTLQAGSPKQLQKGLPKKQMEVWNCHSNLQFLLTQWAKFSWSCPSHLCFLQLVQLCICKCHDCVLLKNSFRILHVLFWRKCGMKTGTLNCRRASSLLPKWRQRVWAKFCPTGLALCQK